ncbi:type II secretion system protein GspG [Lampropedia puyangensis]|uniref:Type II secretion system core protein G n=1 Tax=Lampropedia puyangensis TaxID=1330072 RepID=A0A4S8FCI7_9BURK|nr:type II secretion system major pseudopilin GspG [Lampropedia puyangensis]THU04565.1 type II secretion system protein GspG [Lampropedia puyangensis]
MFLAPSTSPQTSSRASFEQHVQRGFTLIEIMVVVVIIGVLAALVAPSILGRTDEARQTAARADISTIMTALKLYRTDNMRYPTSDQGLQALVARPTTEPVPTKWSRPYLDNAKLPKDPWGNPYVYVFPGVYGEVDILSYGADGKPGGEGADADIGSWQ